MRVQSLADREFLVPKVIELQHHGVGLTTVLTRVRLEERDQPLRALERQTLSVPTCFGDVLLTVRDVMSAPILGLAVAAVVLPRPLSPAMPGEVLETLLDPASPAPPHEHRLGADPDIRSYPKRPWSRIDSAARGCGVVACTSAFQAERDRVRFPPPALRGVAQSGSASGWGPEG